MQQAALLVLGLGTRAQDTPELEDEDNEFTNLLGAKCKEDAEVREVAEDRGVQPVHEFRGAEDGDAPHRLLPKGAIVQLHGLCKDFECNGHRGTIQSANRNTTGEHEYIVKIVKKPGDTITKFRVSQTYIKLVQEKS